MFGAFRLILALMVVHSHFAGGDLGGPVAVFGFFCLSGYLMTKIVNETYSDGFAGYLRFLGNRALRIYPAYYAALAFAVAVLLLWPAEARTAAGWYRLPQDWLQTLSIIGLQPRSPILIVPAWSLHVEMINFILIGALLGRSKLLTALWFFCSLAVTIVAIVQGVSFDWLYFSPFGSSVAFATGAMIYQFREKLPTFSLKLATTSCCAFFIVGSIMPFEIARAGGLHASIIIAAVVIAALRNMPTLRWDSEFRRSGLSGLSPAHPLSRGAVWIARTLRCMGGCAGDRGDPCPLLFRDCCGRATSIPDPREAAIVP